MRPSGSDDSFQVWKTYKTIFLVVSARERQYLVKFWPLLEHP